MITLRAHSYYVPVLLKDLRIISPQGIRTSEGVMGTCSEKLHPQYYLEMLWSKMGYFGLLGNKHILFIILLYLIER